MRITSGVREMIRPSSPSPPPLIISLSPIDQVVPRLYTKFLLIFTNPLPVESLKLSLSTTLTIFYPLAGRYTLLPNNSLQLHCTDDGAEFHEVNVDGELVDFHGSGDFDSHDPRFQLLSPSTGAPDEGDITRAPLLLVQVSHFSCGETSLVVALHHNVADGFSMSRFVTAWSQITTGQSHRVDPPCFDRTLLSSSFKNSNIVLEEASHGHHEYQTSLPIFPAVFPELKACMFDFTNERLQSLRSACHPGATRFEALTGHIWKFVTIARKLQPEQVTKLGFSVEGRARLTSPSLPENYFGNAIFYACATARVEDLVSRPTSYAVKLVHEAVSRMSDEYMRSAVEWLERQESPLKVFPAFCNAETDLAMTSWSRFPLYEAEFGCGKPVFVGLPVAAFNGLVVLLPCPTSQRLRALVGLYAEHMENLVATQEFSNLMY